MKIVFKIHHINVGNTEPKDVPAFMEQIKTNIRMSTELKDFINKNSDGPTSIFIEELFIPFTGEGNSYIDIQEIQF